MELNDFIKKFKEHGFKETKSKSELTIYLQKDMKDDDDDDILVYCNNMSFFTNYIQISVTHQGIAFFIKDGLLNTYANDIETLRLF